MFDRIKSMFSSGPTTAEVLNNGAVVLDVRSEREFQNGHVEGSIHIPLPQLAKKINAIKKQRKPVVTVCASGVRSGRAAKLLRSHGVDAHNGGGWFNVDRLLRQR